MLDLVWFIGRRSSRARALAPTRCLFAILHRPYPFLVIPREPRVVVTVHLRQNVIQCFATSIPFDSNNRLYMWFPAIKIDCRKFRGIFEVRGVILRSSTPANGRCFPPCENYSLAVGASEIRSMNYDKEKAWIQLRLKLARKWHRRVWRIIWTIFIRKSISHWLHQLIIPSKLTADKL